MPNMPRGQTSPGLPYMMFMFFKIKYRYSIDPGKIALAEIRSGVYCIQYVSLLVKFFTKL